MILEICSSVSTVKDCSCIVRLHGIEQYRYVATDGNYKYVDTNMKDEEVYDHDLRSIYSKICSTLDPILSCCGLPSIDAVFRTMMAEKYIQAEPFSLIGHMH